jgi:hypothetical protein
VTRPAGSCTGWPSGLTPGFRQEPQPPPVRPRPGLHRRLRRPHRPDPGQAAASATRAGGPAVPAGLTARTVGLAGGAAHRRHMVTSSTGNHQLPLAKKRAAREPGRLDRPHRRPGRQGTGLHPELSPAPRGSEPVRVQDHLAAPESHSRCDTPGRSGWLSAPVSGRGSGPRSGSKGRSTTGRTRAGPAARSRRSRPPNGRPRPAPSPVSRWTALRP